VIYNFIRSEIDKEQEVLTSYEKVVAFILLEEAFNIESKTMTNTLKIKRKFVEKQFMDQINELYLTF